MSRSLATAFLLAAALGLTSAAAAADPIKPGKVVVKTGDPPKPEQPQQKPDQQWKLGVKIGANAGGGLYVHEVFADSPAAAVGLKAGVVIHSIDGARYDDPLQARDRILFQSGDTLTLVIQENGQFFQVTAQLTTTTLVVAGVKTAAPKAKNLKKVPVADPRKK